MARVVNQDLRVWIKKLGQKTTREFLNMGNVTNLKENKTLFIPCDCDNEILVIEYDHEWGIADVAIYESYISYGNKMSLWQRIRYCWRVFIHKKPYADQLTLNDKQLKELKDFLSSLDLKK